MAAPSQGEWEVLLEANLTPKDIINYGIEFTVTFESDPGPQPLPNIDSVVLINLGTVTHCFDSCWDNKLKKLYNFKI